MQSLHRRLHADMADAGDDDVRMRVFDLMEERGKISGVWIEANMIEHLQPGFRQAFEIAGVERRGPGGIFAHHYSGLQMERTDQHVFGVVADSLRIERGCEPAVKGVFVMVVVIATHEQHDGCGVEEGARLNGGLEVLGQPSIAPDPGEEPLDDPTPRVNGKADLIGIVAHDLDRDQRCSGGPLTDISAVGEDTLDERKMRRETCRSGPPPSRSWILAGCGSSTRPRPSVSTSAWRLRPLIFFPAS